MRSITIAFILCIVFAAPGNAQTKDNHGREPGNSSKEQIDTAGIYPRNTQWITSVRDKDGRVLAADGEDGVIRIFIAGPDSPGLSSWRRSLEAGGLKQRGWICAERRNGSYIMINMQYVSTIEFGKPPE